MGMQPTTQQQAELTIVGMATTATPMTPAIAALWGSFALRIHEVPFASEPGVRYGLMSDFNQGTGQFEYLAGVAVSEVGDLPQGMTSRTVPAGSYAVFDATLSTLASTFEHIFRVDGSRRGLRSPTFERYGAHFDPEDPTSRVTVHLPEAPAVAG